MLEHGGQLRAAAVRYGIPIEQWLDLSTGINPHGYPPPAIPTEVWLRLPQEDDGLEQAAASYYGSRDLLPVGGSQAAIQALPRVRAHSRVAILSPGYAEHAQAWRSAGHEVLGVNADEIDALVDAIAVLVLMQPNNPTGAMFTREQLRAWHGKLAARGGWLVVDEAFIEATCLPSMAQPDMPQGLIVLRSLGKFFGLAGARVGFVVAHATVRAAVRELLGPWAVPGPSRHVAQAALRDGAWHTATRARLQCDGARLARLLQDAGLPPSGGCGLFQWVQTERAEALHQRCAQRGILTRYFAEPRALRFGLPGSEAGWERLRFALEQECAA
jgi:cobalamin biosynthetic protein CobC